MKNVTTNLTALNTLTSNFPSILTECFVVTIYSNNISLQAVLDDKSLTMAKQLGVSLAMHEEYNWLEGSIELEGALVNLTLCAR